MSRQARHGTIPSDLEKIDVEGTGNASSPADQFGRLSRPRADIARIAGAAVLSLLASPHAYWDDLALLVPAAAWSLTTLVARGARAGSLATGVGAIWVLISVAAYLDIATDGAAPAGLLTPWTLVAAAVLAILVCVRQPAPQSSTASTEGGLAPARHGPEPAAPRG